MPIYVFKSPEGKEYEVEGPEGSTHAQAWEMLQKQLGTQTPTQPSKSLGAGDYLDASLKSAKYALENPNKSSHRAMTDKTLAAIAAAKGEATPFMDTQEGRGPMACNGR